MTLQSPVASNRTHLSNAPGEERSLPRRATQEPDSLQAAIDEMSLLRIEIMDIQSQFARRKLDEDSPDRDTVDAYRHWKTGAVGAIKAKEARHSFLKHWISQHQGSQHQSQHNHAGTRQRTPFVELLAEVVTVLEQGEDAALALQRLIAWRDAWLDAKDD